MTPANWPLKNLRTIMFNQLKEEGNNRKGNLITLSKTEVALKRSYSSRTFRYGYLVTT